MLHAYNVLHAYVCELLVVQELVHMSIFNTWLLHGRIVIQHVDHAAAYPADAT